MLAHILRSHHLDIKSYSLPKTFDFCKLYNRTFHMSVYQNNMQRLYAGVPNQYCVACVQTPLPGGSVHRLVLWELNSFLTELLSFIAINLGRLWPHE